MLPLLGIAREFQWNWCSNRKNNALRDALKTYWHILGYQPKIGGIPKKVFGPKGHTNATIWPQNKIKTKKLQSKNC